MTDEERLDRIAELREMITWLLAGYDETGPTAMQEADAKAAHDKRRLAEEQGAQP